MKVRYEGKELEIQAKGNYRVQDLLRELKLNPEEVLVSRNGEILPESERLRDEDEVEIIKVISGG